jgi:hypothetical protein
MRLGDLLLHRGLVTAEQIQEALRQKKPGELLGRTLVRLGLVREDDVLHALSEQLRMPIVELAAVSIDASLLEGPTRELALRHRVIPIERVNGVVRVAVSDPFDTRAAEELAAAYGAEVKLILARPSEIERALEELRSATRRRSQATVAELLEKMRDECDAERQAAEALSGAVARARASGDAEELVAAVEAFGAEAAARMERCLRLLGG